MSSDDQPKPVSEFISQAYILHRTGLVSLSRIYEDSCISGDPQLIGGFIAAMLTFMKQSYNEAIPNCPGNPDGEHKLLEISTSCSKWYIVAEGEYISALLIPNTSPLQNEADKKLIVSLSENLLNSYLLFEEFNITVEESLEEENGGNEDTFGNTVDNIVADLLTKIKGFNVTFEEKGSLEQFDLGI